MPSKNLLITLSGDLHRKFKVKLAQEGRTGKEFFLTIIKHYVSEAKNDEKKPDRSQGVS